MTAEQMLFFETINRLYSRLGACSVSWARLCQLYMQDFNGMNPMTTSQKMQDIMTMLPVLHVPHKGVWFEFSYCNLGTSRMFTEIRRFKRVTVQYTMEVTAKASTKASTEDETVMEYTVPGLEFGTLVSDKIIEPDEPDIET